MSDSESLKAKYSPDIWDEIRLSFSTSLMVDTKLISLSQNLEITEWPISGNNETPSKYIDYTYEELLELPGLADKPKRIDLLIDILRETMEFDDPFGDMVSTVDAATQKEDNIGKNLDKVGIPKDFPLIMSNLSEDTLNFCANEEITNLGEFAEFAQGMAENIVLGGDFKTLLNALNHLDEDIVSKLLPFRPRHTGLHLQEAIALILTKLSEGEKVSLLKRYGKKMKGQQADQANLTKDQMAQLEEIIIKKIDERCQFFGNQLDKLCRSLKDGVTLERYFMVLNDQDTELIASKLMARYLKEGNHMASIKDDTEKEPEKKSGFFSRLFGRG